MSSIMVRPYEAGDREALIRLWSEVFPDDPPRNAPELMIDSKSRVQPDLLLLAHDGPELVGAVMAGDDGTRGWVHHLAVHPRHRRKGVGTTLMQAAEAGLSELGCPKVNLQVRAGNEAVLEFYRALGYRVEERVSLGKLLGESI